MADIRHRKTLGNRLRFLIRGIGLLGLFAAAIGLVLASTVFDWPQTWSALRDTSQAVWNAALPTDSHDFTHVAALILLIGLAAAALALVVEFLSALFLAATRRTAVGASGIIAVAAAIALLVFVNLYSFRHYERKDLTRDHQFTLPTEVSSELRQLRPDMPTTIVVLQKHRTFGATSEARDAYVSASESKVTEKVKDLVNQFREFGPHFNVVVLDTEQLDYDSQVAALTDKAPQLKAAIDAAPENSILFAAGNKVQRLGFNEFLQLDRAASRQANGGRGNLVLLPQGVEKFARRVLAVQERRPKIALCVVHGALGADGVEELTHAGLKKMLLAQGFELKEIVLKDWTVPPDGGPAAFTLQEIKIQEIESELDEAEFKIALARNEVTGIDQLKEMLTDKKKGSFKERFSLYSNIYTISNQRAWREMLSVYQKYAEHLIPNEAEFTKVEPAFKKELLEKLPVQKALSEQQVKNLEEKRKPIEARLTEALKDENAVQNAHETDVKAKFTRLLADVDLLVIPRFTVLDVAKINGVIPASVHVMSKDQVAVVRDFMKSGRPVLALLGPISETLGPAIEAVDGFEKLIADRGVELGNETIIYDEELKALAEQGIASRFGSASHVEVEPLQFADRVESDAASEIFASSKQKNPIRAAVQLSARSLEKPFELRLRGLRPVYVKPDVQSQLTYASEFILSGPNSWNEIQPLRQRGSPYLPKFEAAKEGDSKKGTHAEERRGPFPIGVAIDGPLPKAWFDQPNPAIPNERLVVIGHGGAFVGSDLKPVQEKLLLHSVNWLLNRSDRLPMEPEKTWSYPRVDMTARDLVLWRWSTALLMPLGVVILGLFAVMLRRSR